MKRVLAEREWLGGDIRAVIDDAADFAAARDADAVEKEIDRLAATGIRFPKGASTTDEPLYRVLVYGKDEYLVSLAEARDSGITPAEEQFLKSSAFATPAAWDAQFSKIMATHDREVSGQATIRLSDGSSRSVPYFAWSRSIGSKTHYAVMYVTIHRGAFIAVQVEGSKPFTEESVKALTSSLELTVAPPAPAPAS